MVNYTFDAFLDSVGQGFVQYFCINVHKRDWSEVLLPCLVLIWFRYKHYCGFIEWVGKCSLRFYFMEKFEEYQYELFFEDLIEFTTKPRAFFCWET